MSQNEVDVRSGIAGSAPKRRVLSLRTRTVQFAFVVFIGTVLAIGPTTEFFLGNLAATRVAIIVVTAVFTVFALRVVRLAIVIDGERLVVRNVFRTYRIPRFCIVRVEPPAPYGRMWKAGLLVHLGGGKVISASAFARTPVDDPAGAVPAADLLTTWITTGKCPSVWPPRQAAMATRRRRLTGWRIWLGLLGLLVAFAVLLIVGALVDPTVGN